MVCGEELPVIILLKDKCCRFEHRVCSPLASRSLDWGEELSSELGVTETDDTLPYTKCLTQGANGCDEPTESGQGLFIGARVTSEQPHYYKESAQQGGCFLTAG